VHSVWRSGKLDAAQPPPAIVSSVRPYDDYFFLK
jgi:hypothetical protein